MEAARGEVPPETSDDTDTNQIELGDLITVYGKGDSVSGSVVYRDNSTIKVVPVNASDRAVIYNLNNDGDFEGQHEVYLVERHARSKFYHYSLILNVNIDDRLEFFTAEGEIAAEDGVVKKVNATNDSDSIELEDGRTLIFDGKGPQTGKIEVIRIISSTSVEENNVAPGESDTTEVDLADQAIMTTNMIDALLLQLPISTYTEIATADQFFSDDIQRQEMYSSMLNMLPIKSQKLPRVLRKTQQETEYLLALKRDTVQTTDTGRPIGPRNYVLESFDNIMQQRTVTTLQSVVPVAEVRRSIYLDKIDGDIFTDLSIRNGITRDSDGMKIQEDYIQNRHNLTAPKPFHNYLDKLLSYDNVVEPADPNKIDNVLFDQEYLVTGDLRNSDINGLSSKLNSPYAAANMKKEILAASRDNYMIDIGSITKVQHNTQRLLSAVYDKTGRTVRSERVTDAGVVILPPDLAVMLRDPPAASLHQKVLLAHHMQKMPVYSLVNTLRDTETSEDDGAEEMEINLSKPRYIPAGRKIKDDDGEFMSAWLLSSIKRGTSVIQRLGHRDHMIQLLMDTVGQRNLELPSKFANSLQNLVEYSQGEWQQAHNATATRAMTAQAAGRGSEAVAEAEKNQLVSNSVIFGSNVLVAIEIQLTLSDFSKRDPILEKSDIARAEAILSGYKGILGMLWIGRIAKTNNMTPSITEEFARTRIQLMSRFELVKKQRDRLKAKLLYSNVEINKCPHVRLLEGIRRVRDPGRYATLFRKFIQQFQGNRDGNWFNCTQCSQHCLCTHDILLFNETVYPAQKATIHKQLLLDYGGGVFSGRYHCINCGQGIQDLEYETTMEFDDEGKPMSGVNVMTPEEQMAELSPELNMVQMMNEKEVEFRFSTPEEKVLYKVAKDIFERIGCNPSTFIFLRVVRRAMNYLNEKSFKSEDEYTIIETTRRKQKGGKIENILPYNEFVSGQKIAAVGACVVIELQTMTPPLEILMPFRLCNFSRRGYPAEGSKQEPGGAADYVTCCMNGIRRDGLWSQAYWNKDNNILRRQKRILNHTCDILKIIIGNANEGEMLSITAEVLQVLKNSVLIFAKRDSDTRPSNSDRLPNQFRPWPHPNQNATQGVIALGQDIRKELITMRSTNREESAKYHTQRAHLLMQEILAGANSKAEEYLRGTIGQEVIALQGPALNGLLTLEAVGIGGLIRIAEDSVMAESARLNDGIRILKMLNPCESSNGSHINLHWSPPEHKAIEGVADEMQWYKLFVKNCYKGTNTGLPHEVSYGNVCRHCDFKFGEPPSQMMTLVDRRGLSDKEQSKSMEVEMAEMERLLKERLTQNGAVITSETFDQLLDEVRRKRPVPEIRKLIEPEQIDGLNNMKSLAERVGDIGELQIWKAVIAICKHINDIGDITSDIIDEKWSDFTSSYDQAKLMLEELIDKSNIHISGVKTDRTTIVLIESLEELTRNPFDESPRLLREYIVVRAKVAKTQRFTETLPGPYYKNLVRQQVGTLIEVLKKHANPAKENVGDLAKIALNLFAHRFSLLLNDWCVNVHPWINVGLTGDIAQTILRFILYRQLIAIGNKNDSYFDDETSGETRELAAAEAFKFVLKNVHYAVTAIFKYNEDEIRAKLIVRQEKERQTVLKMMDDIKDEELRYVEKIKKLLGIGQWSVGSMMKNKAMTPELYEYFRLQRISMGIPEFPGQTTTINEMPNDESFDPSEIKDDDADQTD